MPSPAPRPREDELDDAIGQEHGWPRPRELRDAPPPPSSPRRRPPPRRRPRLGRVWIALAVLGVALAAVAGVWYSRLDQGPPARLTVPRVVGLKESVAIRKLTTLGLAVRSVEMPLKGKTGRVVRQRPAAGVMVARGRAVTIDVASGK